MAATVLSGTLVRPGMFFLTSIPGVLGRTASGAQAFTRGGAPFTHTGMYVGGGIIMQSEWGGARLRDFTSRYGDREVLWSDAVIQRHLAEEHPGGRVRFAGYEDRLRDAVVECATGMAGSPYGLSTVLTIAGAEFRIPGWRRLHTWSTEHGRLICSTLVVTAYRLAGIPLFPDQDVVTPGDLYRLDAAWTRHRLADLESRVAAIEERIA